MSIQQKIQQDMVAALKARDQKRRGTLSFVASELKRAAIDKRVETLGDPETISILKKQLKQRQEAIDAARKAGRAEMIEQNEYEVAVIGEYLPPSLSEEETRALAAAVVSELGASALKDMSKVMAEATRRAPSVDKGKLSAIVRTLLGATR